MNIAIDQRPDATIVTVDGSLDALTAEQLHGAFSGAMASGGTQLVAAFGGLEYTSSAGLRVLLAAMREARRRGGDLRLAAVSAKVNRVLALSGFTSILKCYPDVDSAVASYRAAGRA